MIELRNLTRKYGDLAAVSDVSLTIERGQVVGLLGHNGAGKTTMMRMLTGYLEPSSGSVHVDGLDVAQNREAVQRRIGYLPESAPLYGEMLVQDYLATMAELRGVPRRDVRAAVVDAARRTGLLERMTQPIATLSKGFRQRVGLAQAIVHRPDVLILDEPTNGLDPAQIRSIRELILDLGESATVILSTHILQEVEAVCDRVVVLIGGKLAADAPLADLVDSHALTLSVEDSAEGVAAAVTAIDGIVAAEPLGSDPKQTGFSRWRLRCEGPQLPVQRVVEVAAENHWTLGGVAPETRTLEAVFRELEASHLAQEEAA
jgi:ABC-2 type transport system ATP-binding protein